jgi:hypothetical protein
VQAQLDSSTFVPAGGTGTLRVSTDRECLWSAQSDAEWLRLPSPADGQGNGSVQFTVDPHTGPSARTAGISVKDQRVQISQAGRPCEFRLSTTHESVGAPGGERTIEVNASSAQCRWTAAADAPWITIVAGREGTGNGTVVVQVGAVSGPPRNGTITVAGQIVQVEQGTGCTVSIAPSSVRIGPQGGAGSIQVDAAAGCLWTATTDASWIRVSSAATGSGAGRVEFSVASNQGEERTGTLTIAGRPVTVSQQEGCSFAVDRDRHAFTAAGGSGVAGVTAAPGCAWSATSGNAWITITGPNSGSGTGQVQFAVSANSGPAREGTLMIRGTRLTIAQASGCTYGLAPAGQDVPATGGSGVMSLTTGADCAWNAASSASWIALSGSAGAGPGQVRFDATSNPGAPRSATITIGGQIFTVNQASSCTFLLAPPSHEFDANGGGGNILVIVSGACTWTAASNTDWIRITTGASGTGNGLVQFTAAPNSGPARTGSLTIAGQQYVVAQRRP